jgi:hypothetical protein
VSAPRSYGGSDSQCVVAAVGQRAGCICCELPLRPRPSGDFQSQPDSTGFKPVVIKLAHFDHLHPFSVAAHKISLPPLPNTRATGCGSIRAFSPSPASIFHSTRLSCRRGWEKGKVERAIGYVRQIFWPLRSFADLSDVNSQART